MKNDSKAVLRLLQDFVGVLLLLKDPLQRMPGEIEKLSQLLKIGRVSIQINNKEGDTIKIPIFEATGFLETGSESIIRTGENPNGIYEIVVTRHHLASVWSEEEKNNIEFLMMLIYMFLEKHLYSENTEKNSNNDVLTGSLNMNGALKAFETFRGKQNQAEYTCFFVNFVNFTKINKTLGFQTGNEVLIRFAKIISSYIGNKGFLVRLGADKFSVLIQDDLIEGFLHILNRYEHHYMDNNKEMSYPVLFWIGAGKVTSLMKRYNQALDIAHRGYLDARTKKIYEVVYGE